MNGPTVIALLLGGLFVLFVRLWSSAGRRRKETAQGIPVALVMFTAAMAGAVAGGWVAFRSGIFQPELQSFQVFTTGALMAGILTLTRIGRAAAAVVLGVGWILYQFGGVMNDGFFRMVSHTIWSVTLVTGIFIITLIWEFLAQRGFRLGKALLVGPLLGGVYVAAVPVTLLHGVSSSGALRSMLLTLFLGIVIGDGVGIGVEIVEVGSNPKHRSA